MGNKRISIKSIAWQQIDKNKIATVLFDRGFRYAEEVMNIRTFDLLNIFKINAGIAGEAILILYSLYNPNPIEDEGMDYHMIDVDIDELLTMIPNLEEMVPMLSSFKGAAEFHLAAETYLNSQYQPKMSTLRGAASLTGKDLVVLDGETFDKISKLLLFSKKTENKIDSINAELTIYKNQIDVYPLCVQMDNYMVALGGRHNTNMTFDYKCKFAQDFKPHWYQKVDNQSRELRERIKQSMEKNVRIK